MPTPFKFGCLSCVVHRVHTVYSARWRYCDVLLLGQQVLLSFVGGTDLSLAASEGLPVLLDQYFCMNMMSKTGHHTSVPLRMLLMLWREQASPLAWCPANQSLAGMCRRYKMPPATSSPGAALGLSAHRRNFVHAVSDSIVVVSERNFRIVGCFVYHWLCWSLPGNIASNVISRSLGEISMIHGQPKRTKPNMFTGIAMHTALDVNNPRIRSSEARACKRYDWGNADAFFLAIFSGLQDTLPTFGRCPSSLGAGKPCTCQVQIFNLLSCVLGRIKEGSSSSESAHGSMSKHVASKRLIFRKDVPIWDICESAIISAGFLHWVPTFLDLPLFYSSFGRVFWRQLLTGLIVSIKIR